MKKTKKFLLFMILPIFLSIFSNTNANENKLHKIDINSLKTLSILKNNHKIHLLNYELIEDSNKLYIWDPNNDNISVFNIISGDLITEIKLNDKIKYFFHDKNDDIWKTMKPKCMIAGLYKDEKTKEVYLNALTRTTIKVYDKSNNDSLLVGGHIILMVNISNDTIGEIHEVTFNPYYFTGVGPILFDSVLITEFSTNEPNENRLLLFDKKSNYIHTFLNSYKLEKELKITINRHSSGFLVGNELNNLFYYCIPDIPPLKLNVFSNSNSFELIPLKGKLKKTKNFTINNIKTKDDKYYTFSNLAVIDSFLITEVIERKKQINEEDFVINSIYLQIYKNNLDFIGEIEITNNDKKQKIYTSKLIGQYLDNLMILMKINNKWHLKYFPIKELFGKL